MTPSTADDARPAPGPVIAGLLPAPPRAGLRHLAIAVVLAVAGGVFGIAGAFFEEVRAGGFILLPLIGAPIIEEALKPSGLYLFLARWPYAVRQQLLIATLAALGGLTFGLIESTIYVQLYVSDPSDDYVAFRYTVPVAMHGAASFIAGLGIHTRLLDWASGRSPLPASSRNAFLAAFVLHGGYNALAIALAIAGVWDFD